MVNHLSSLLLKSSLAQKSLRGVNNGISEVLSKAGI